MTDRIDRPITPITSVDDLVARFHLGNKPRASWLIGVEHEKIGVVADTGAAIPYSGPNGIEALLDRLARDPSWKRTTDGDHTIGLTRTPERVSLEPGGQLELSGDPLATLTEIAREIKGHLADLRGPSEELGLAWLGVGFRPFGSLEAIEWVPKGRYQVMREVLAPRGALAHDMMKRTATVQANVDWSDEEDAGRKLRAAFSVTSIVTALFAASPLVDGEETGYQSFRGRVWLDTDDDRCGLLPFAFEEGNLFRRYTEWALDVPMLFLYRGDYRATGGLTFRRFMREGFGDERATIEDWDTHLSTLFPEARLKNYLEVRGADAGPLDMVLALPAFWQGLLYDDDSCRAAIALTADLSFADRVALRANVPARGLTTRLANGRRALDIAREMLAIARAGLTRLSPGDLAFLAPLEEIAATGRTVADKIVDVWRSSGADPARFTKRFSLIG